MNTTSLSKIFSAIVILLAFAGCEDEKGTPHNFADNNPLLVIAVGDSITEGGYPASLATLTHHTVVDSGSGGANSGQGLSLLQIALAAKPGYVLLMFGSNDIIQGEDLDDAAVHIRAMIKTAKANNTAAVVATIPPMLGVVNTKYVGSIEYLNGLITKIAKEEGIGLAKAYSAINNDENLMAADGLHPNAAGNLAIAAAFKKRIK